jgi:SSS family solute:Na+ symporter
MTLAVILIYLGMVLAIGLLSQRLFRGTGEDYFVATRSIGPVLLLMSLFGTHMTAFSLLGAAGESYRNGLGVFALMASSSAIVVPTVIFLVGPRVWSVGRRHGYLTQVQYFRERFQSDGLGLLLFVLLTALLVPYLLIGVMGGGIAMNQITSGQVAPWVGGLLICSVVLAYVTAGGLRGTAWANAFQTVVFMILGAATFALIVNRMGGLQPALDAVAAEAPELLVRGPGIPPLKLLSYTLIPLSIGMFPHIFMHWLTARRASTFRLTVMAYPLFVAIVWLPSVLLGVLGRVAVPGLEGPETNAVLVRMIELYSPGLVAGLLGAGVFAAVMSSLDSQVLSLGTMFTQDIVRHFGFHDRMSERGQVLAGRLFVVAILMVTYGLSLVTQPSIFKLGIWSFTGFAALFPLIVAALFWRRSTRAGAYAGALTVAVGWLYFFIRDMNGAPSGLGSSGLMPVAVLLVACSVAVVGVSLVTRPPEAGVLEDFFPSGGSGVGSSGSAGGPDPSPGYST